MEQVDNVLKVSSRHSIGGPQEHDKKSEFVGTREVCEHQGRSAVRIYSATGWVSLCVDCWRTHRRFYQSIDIYSHERGEQLATRARNANDQVMGMATKATEEGNRGVLDESAERQHTPDHARVLLYSHDTYGLGHLRRNLAIAEQLLQGPFDVQLLSGSPVLRSCILPPRLTVQSLPPVIKVAAERYTARDSNESFALVKGYREALILKAVLHYRPNVFLVDHAAAGMNGELLSTLALIRREMPDTRIILGLRDILDSADTVRALWQEQDVYHLLADIYDHIFVYGSRHLFDIAKEYDLSPAVAKKLTYCGYVARGGLAPVAVDAQKLTPGSTPQVLVTAGGGDDGYPLMAAYLQALDSMPAESLRSVLVTGPLMPAEQRRSLEQMAALKPGVTIIPFATELTDLVRASDLVVAMAGYNTSAEILALRKPAILVPRLAPRAEQRMRAALLAKLGLVWTLLPGDDFAAQLAEKITSALTVRYPEPPQWDLVNLGGAARVADVLKGLRVRAHA